MSRARPNSLLSAVASGAMSQSTISHSNGAEPHRASGSPPLVSVVIPALNEEATIGMCLDALCHMDREPPGFEVIIVDNGSTDNTIDVAARYYGLLDLRIVKRPGVHISAARNFGVEHAQGSVLAFLDADCIVPRGWLSSLLHRIRNTRDFAILGAHYRIPQGSSWVAKAWHADHDAHKIGEVSYVPAGNMIITRKVFATLGGFNEAIQTNEDAELCHRARLLGFSTQAFTDVAVEHLGTPQTIASFYRKQRWHGKDVLNVFMHTRGQQNSKVVALALLTLLAAAGLALSIGIRNWLLMIVSAAVLFAPPAMMGFRAGIKQRDVAHGAAVALLTLVYALARCRCLLDVRFRGTATREQTGQERS